MLQHSLKDELRNMVKSLQDQHRTLTSSIALLEAEKEKLESIIGAYKGLLQVALTQALTNLQYQRPDLFTLSGMEQIALLAQWFSDQLTH